MKFFSFILFCCISLSLIAQEEEKKFEFSGYVTDMPSVITQSAVSEVWWENLVHNRLNFAYNFNENWRVDVGMRNRLMIGNLIETPGYAESIDFDRGWADMSWNIIAEDKVIFNTSFDRAFVTFNKNKWNAKLGRQRINWGQTLVWNPNDIFNTYSYFDFDYVERAGCDAFRGTYYYNETAYSELAVSVDYNDKLTAAFLHHWNKNNFDYQIIGGMMSQSDVLIGGAVTTDFKGLNLRTEGTYFHPVDNFSDTSGVFAISFGTDYIFENSLMLQGEVLYNNVGNIFSSIGILGLYAAPLSAKYLSICDWTIFAQASYPITPRLNASVSGMIFTEVDMYYAGLSLDYSLAENIDLSLYTQYFISSSTLLGDNNVFMGFLRLKWAF